LCSSSTSRISDPTKPVAPTTANFIEIVLIGCKIEAVKVRTMGSFSGQ
jgi:hypothetical protein